MFGKIVLGAIAMSYAWGVRGTVAGAMRGATFAGAILGLTVAAISDASAVREAWLFLTAVGALAVGFGGCMTYGQTLGLTHGNPPPAYWWGLLGTAVKGTVWIGLGTLLMAMVVSPVGYTAGEWGFLIIIGILAWSTGFRNINMPMDPPHRLPYVYFSERSEDARLEYWGGMWGLFLILLLYVFIAKNDYFTTSMAGFGLLGGLGFPLGQVLQSWGSRKVPFGPNVQPHIDWWKVMELFFGAFAGAVIVYGWLWAEKTYLTAGSLSLNIGNGVASAGNIFASQHPLPTAPLWIISAALWLVGIALERRWKPTKSPAGTWWTLLYIHTLPLVVLAAGNVLWAALVAAPLIFWVVGITVPPRAFDTTATRIAATIVVIIGIAGSLFWATTSAMQPAHLWRAIIVYHMVLTYFKYWSNRGTNVRALLHPASIVLTVMTVALVVWPVFS